MFSPGRKQKTTDIGIRSFAVFLTSRLIRFLKYCILLFVEKWDYIFSRFRRSVQLVLSRSDGSDHAAVDQKIRSGNKPSVFSQQKCSGLCDLVRRSGPFCC